MVVARHSDVIVSLRLWSRVIHSLVIHSSWVVYVAAKLVSLVIKKCMLFYLLCV